MITVSGTLSADLIGCCVTESSPLLPTMPFFLVHT